MSLFKDLVDIFKKKEEPTLQEELNKITGLVDELLKADGLKLYISTVPTIKGTSQRMFFAARIIDSESKVKFRFDIGVEDLAFFKYRVNEI